MKVFFCFVFLKKSVQHEFISQEKEGSLIFPRIIESDVVVPGAL